MLDNELDLSYITPKNIIQNFTSTYCKMNRLLYFKTEKIRLHNFYIPQILKGYMVPGQKGFLESIELS